MLHLAFLATLLYGIATMWIPARWSLTAFQLAIFLLTGIWMAGRFFRKAGRPTVLARPRVIVISILLCLVAAWGPLQRILGGTVDPARTGEAAIAWITNVAAFGLALHLGANPRARARALYAMVWFGLLLALLAMLTEFSSPPGLIAWRFDSGTGVPTFGPFVYRNQFAAMIEVLLPIALLQALSSPRGRPVAIVASAVMFAAVVASGSRTGSILCFAEVLVVPLLALSHPSVSGRAVLKTMAITAAGLGAFTLIAGWQFLWSRLQEANPWTLRLDLTYSSAVMILDRPWTGWGLGTWPVVYPGFARFDDGLFVNQAHNDWLQWAAEGGIPFAILLLCAVLLLVRPAFRTVWGIGILCVVLHCLVDYPMQQRPALAAFFIAMFGLILGSQATDPEINGGSFPVAEVTPYPHALP